MSWKVWRWEVMARQLLRKAMCCLDLKLWKEIFVKKLSDYGGIYSWKKLKQRLSATNKRNWKWQTRFCLFFTRLNSWIHKELKKLIRFLTFSNFNFLKFWLIESIVKGKVEFEVFFWIQNHKKAFKTKTLHKLFSLPLIILVPSEHYDVHLFKECRKFQWEFVRKISVR